MSETWSSFSWYCPNCGRKVTGYENKNGSMKVECKTCRFVMVRTFKKTGHNIIEVFPSGSLPEEL